MKSLWMLPLLLLCCCGDKAPTDPKASTATLVTYNVPNGMGAQVVNVLNHNLAAIRQTSSPGRAELLPNGAVALLAPPQVHSGMDTLLASLAHQKPPEAINTRMENWVILSLPGEGGSLQDANLLAALKGTESAGPRKYFQMEKLSVQAAEGNESQATGQFFQAQCKLMQRGPLTLAEFRINQIHGDTDIQTSVYLKKDQYLILGESSFDLRLEDAKPMGLEAGTYEIFYVLKSDMGSEAQ